MSICRWLVRRLNWRDSSARLCARSSPYGGSLPMRFMYIVTPAHNGPPTPELMEAMHKLADREIKAGRMLDSGGLMPLAPGPRARIAAGQLCVVHGPVGGAKGVIGGYPAFVPPGPEKALVTETEVMKLA